MEGHLGHIESLIDRVEVNVKNLGITDQIDLEGIKGIRSGAWLEKDELERAYLGFTENFITIEKRLGK